MERMYYPNVFVLLSLAASLIFPACLRVSSRRAVHVLIRRVSSQCSSESARLRLVNRKIDAVHCNYMKATVPHETLGYMHIFFVLSFDSLRN